MFYTYILLSQVSNKTYAGRTDNLEKRLKEHSDGKETFSRRHRPWKVLYSERFLSEVESAKREKYFKSAAGRRWMKKNLFNI